jgi:hypothetical protein
MLRNFALSFAKNPAQATLNATALHRAPPSAIGKNLL